MVASPTDPILLLRTLARYLAIGPGAGGIIYGVVVRGCKYV